MLTNEVTLNIYLLAFVLGVSVLIGFAFRAGIVLKCKAKIQELEREILNNYEHILEMERDSLDMEMQMQQVQIPVISMKSSNKEIEVISKKAPDITLRKQLLAKKISEQQSASGL